MKISLDLTSVLVGVVVTCFGTYLSHQLTLSRERRARNRIADDEREELLGIIPRQSDPNGSRAEERITFDRLLALTAWTPSRLGLRLRELEATGAIAQIAPMDFSEWFVPHPEGLWGKKR